MGTGERITALEKAGWNVTLRPFTLVKSPGCYLVITESGLEIAARIYGAYPAVAYFRQLLVLALGLSMCDALFTTLGVRLGIAEELMPWWAWLLDYSLFYSCLARLAYMALLGSCLVYLRKRPAVYFVLGLSIGTSAAACVQWLAAAKGM